MTLIFARPQEIMTSTSVRPHCPLGAYAHSNAGRSFTGYPHLSKLIQDTNYVRIHSHTSAQAIRIDSVPSHGFSATSSTARRPAFQNTYLSSTSSSARTFALRLLAWSKSKQSRAESFTGPLSEVEVSCAREWIATVSTWPSNIKYKDMAEVAIDLSRRLRDPEGEHKCDIIIALTHARYAEHA